MTPTRATAVAADQDQDILDCIARAEKKAGGDDAAFIRYLNECYAAKSRAGMRLRGGAAVRGTAAAPVDRSPRSQQIVHDPRYLRNARELARRTQGGTRVIGGVRVPKGAFLDCVAVGSDSQWGCTGTLIAPDVVVTAGHCSSVATRVFFGSDVTKAGKIVKVRQRVRHPDYRQGGRQNDLMVLLLQTRVENIAPRSLAKKTLIEKATDGRVVGFGNTDPLGSSGYGIKRQVDVPIASPSCKGSVDGESDRTAYGCDTGLEFVAGKPLLAKDSCTGDSGGPFYIEEPDGSWVLAGATSRATNSAPNDCGDGGIYVRLDVYRTWIGGIPGVNLP
jgi:secreted trypsin-like serine protease